MVTSHDFRLQLFNCSIMVKEKSDKKKKEAPALTEVQGDIEMEDVGPEKVCHIQALVV